MSANRELLEMAAKAAGYTPDGSFGRGILVCVNVGCNNQKSFGFDPLNDDGDALRLATKLDIQFKYDRNTPPELGLSRECAIASLPGKWFAESVHHGDKDSAIRRVIVRAAAEIGRAMP